MILEEGLERVFARHAVLARAARAGIEAIGTRALRRRRSRRQRGHRRPVPDDVDGAKVQKLMRDRYGVTALGGQGELKGKIVRIAHCGYFGGFDIVIALTALEMSLRDLGFELEPGAGAGAAQRVFARAARSAAGRVAVAAERTLTDPVPRVLVKEKIADAGVELLRADFDVEVGLDWDEAELERRIGEFDAILIRSATKMTPELIDRAERLKVIGRAGTGVDNVDMDAATKRGIIVANAPESNSIAAAEHTLALALALCRNVPQAHGSLVAGEWARSRYGGNELYGKTLGVIGFGRIGQLVAKRAQAFDMDVVALRQVRLRRALPRARSRGRRDQRGALRRADVITIHLPKTPETVELDRRRGDRRDARRRADRQLRPRRADRPRRPARRARVRQGRRRGPRRLPRGAVHRASAVRARRRRRHPAPRRLDRRGPGPRRHRHRRAGARGALRRRGDQRGQHRRRAARGDGGAGALRAAVREARPARAGPRRRRGRPGRGLVPRAASPSTTPGCSGSRSSSASSPATPRSPSTSSTPRRWPRAAGSSSTELKEPASDDFTELVRVRLARSRSPAPGSARATSPIWSVSGARASTCRSPTTWRSSATPTSRG